MLTVALLTSMFIALAGARVYERCDLARDLLRLGVARNRVSTWVCIAFHESSFNTAAWNTHSGDHGLLQISELYWCGPGKACGLTCSSLRDSDITNDIQCALQIYREHTRLQGDGFMAWVVYPRFCRGNKNYVKGCNRLGKKYSEKLNTSSQLLPKPDVLNFTVPQFVDTFKASQPLPGYLAINSLIQEINFEKFERDYYNNNKKKFDWQNYKIDNIDELKLPSSNRPGRVELAIPPTLTTDAIITTASPTTTLEHALMGIKPPSPRQIETNQYRKRKMKLENKSYKNNNDTLFKTSIVLSKSFSATTNTTETSRSSSKTFLEDFLSLTTTVKPTTGTTLRTTGEANSENPNFKRTQNPTTKKPVASRDVITRKTNEGVGGASTAIPRSVTTLYVTENKERDFNFETNHTEISTKEPKYTFSHFVCNRLPNKTFQTSNTNQNISLSNTNTNKTNAICSNEITSTTPSMLNISDKFVVNMLNKTLNPTTVSQTSTRPQSSSLTAAPQAPQTTKLDPGTLGVGTTHSIFDLYLNPTKKPTLQTFSFAPFNKNPFRMRIFYGGTTPSPSGQNRGP